MGLRKEEDITNVSAPFDVFAAVGEPVVDF